MFVCIRLFAHICVLVRKRTHHLYAFPFKYTVCRPVVCVHIFYPPALLKGTMHVGARLQCVHESVKVLQCTCLYPECSAHVNVRLRFNPDRYPV